MYLRIHIYHMWIRIGSARVVKQIYASVFLSNGKHGMSNKKRIVRSLCISIHELGIHEPTFYFDHEYKD